MAYLNLDVAVSGPRTAFSGSGELQTVVIEQMKKILFPEGPWGKFDTLYDMWYNVSKGEISPLGSGSDYASFYQNGISAVSPNSSLYSLRNITFLFRILPSIVTLTSTYCRLTSGPTVAKPIQSTTITPTTIPTTGCPRLLTPVSNSTPRWGSS